MRLFGLNISRSAPAEVKQEISFNQLIERMATLARVNSGQSVRPSNAMRCTTVQGIVRALTNAVGSYPPAVGQTREGKAGPYIEQLPTHGINRLLRKPNRVQTSTEYWRMVMTHAALHGNHYSIKGQGETGPIQYLRPIEDPNAVSLDDINWALGAVFRVQLDGETRYIPQRNMFHVTSGIPSDDGVTGQSPVDLAKEAIGICLAIEQYMAELYGNNAIPSILLTGGKFTTEEQYNLWVSKWKAAYGAGAERGGTAMLPEGMDAKELAFKPIDAQVLEQRKFQRIEIAQVYGVPPHKLADLERATFSNIEEQSLEFVRDVAKPWVRLIEQAAVRDLITDDDQRNGVVVRFDMEAATEGKLYERLQAYGKAYEVGAMNPNEIRQRLGLDPRDDEGGEAYATALNMRTSDDTTDDPAGEGAQSADDDPEGDADASQLRAV